MDQILLVKMSHFAGFKCSNKQIHHFTAAPCTMLAYGRKSFFIMRVSCDHPVIVTRSSCDCLVTRGHVVLLADY